MARRFSVEFSRRSVFFCIGRIECLIEFQPGDWPVQWAYQVEPSTRELWMGRLYLCMARVANRQVALLATLSSANTDTPLRECKILDFKVPVRTA